ncbi:MAG: hypothetical protein AMXMBFR13_48190 [Phycisphaerae bacterium]
MRPLVLMLSAIVSLASTVPSASAADVTLGDEHLMSLDWHDPAYGGRVLATRDIPGPGVEFDIHFPRAGRSDYGIHYVSSRSGGQGRLAGANLEKYERFALTFALTAVKGPQGQEIIEKRSLVVGALVYGGAHRYAYRPAWGHWDPAGLRQTATSRTKLTKGTLNGLGFECRLPTNDPAWDGEHTVTLLVTPAEDAEILPASLLVPVVQKPQHDSDEKELARKGEGQGQCGAEGQCRPTPAAGTKPDVKATTATLSDEALLALDWHDPAYQAKVISKRDVPGPGVAFEIRFLEPEGPGSAVQYISGKFGGAGKLTGLDLQSYEAFALTFTLESIRGTPAKQATGTLVVGAIVYDEVNGSRFRPEVVSQEEGKRTTTSVTRLKPVPVDGLGFESHFLTPRGWEAGTVVTLLVQPAEGATQISLKSHRTEPDRPHYPASIQEAVPMGAPITYRQWLIGMALSSGKSARDAIREADLVLQELKGEEQAAGRKSDEGASR